MSLDTTRIAYATIVRKEVARFMRIWQQTLMPPVITTSLYFVIFGNLIGPRIGSMEGFRYMDFIVPGLILMSVITNAYSNVSSSFFGAKFQRSIEELQVSPTPNWVILAGYVTGGMVRGLLVGLVVTIVALMFSRIRLHSIPVALGVILLTAMLFSLAGFLNGLFARNFDDVSIIPTFVLTPLIYLGGVFYTINLLPPFWQTVSHVNPILYMINGFRYGFIGISDIGLGLSFAIAATFIVVLFGASLYLLERGYGIRD